MDLFDQPVDADAGEEEILERVAAIDVAKDSGMVCVRVPHQTQPGKRDTSVWSVPARTNSIIALANQWLSRASSGWCLNPHRITGGRSTTCWTRGA